MGRSRSRIGRVLFAAIFGVLSANACEGYPVGPAVSLKKLAEEADFIFKGTAVSSRTLNGDPWFTTYSGFLPWETEFRVISVLKGDKEIGERVSFRHYDRDTGMGIMFSPQYYHFMMGDTYLVFAKKSDSPGTYQQIWMYHKLKEDQGVFRCADEKPLESKKINEVVWRELIAMLDHPKTEDVLYALKQLEQMSGLGKTLVQLNDFDAQKTLEAIHGLSASRDDKIAKAALAMLGSNNPYLSKERTIYWLSTVGAVPLPGHALMDPHRRNLGGELYWKEIVEIAEKGVSADVRKQAILALGLVREPALEERLLHWLSDAEPQVRAAAALLLADYPKLASKERLSTLVEDASADVRANVALTIGYSQQVAYVDILSRLLADNEFSVRQNAAMCLLSFSPRDRAVKEIFESQLENVEFQPLFLNALAKMEPAKYLDGLAKAVEEKIEPKHFWGGQIPAFAAWEILFQYLQKQSTEAIRSGAYNRYLNALEKVGNYSSSEPRDIYAFYLQRGMPERAAQFRQEAVKKASYDIDHYFNQVDQNPSMYKREY